MPIEHRRSFASRIKDGQPTGEVLRLVRKDSYRTALRRICKQAGIRPVKPKDLRDTFASQMLTVGISLGWISNQLGHGNAAVTARYYAAWIGSEGYQNPVQVAEGELPCDVLARLDFGHATNTPLDATKTPRSDGSGAVADSNY